MKTIKSFVNQHATAFFMLILGVVILFSSSCGTADEEGVEDMLQSEDTVGTTPPDAISVNPQVANEGNAGLEVSTFTIDATNEETWAYFSFAAGGTVTVEDALNSEAWDIGFQRTKVKLNGGISGPGMGSATMLTETTFEAVTAAPADGYREDTEDTLAIVPQSEKGWYIYTGPPTHWILPLEDRVFVVKTADGTFAKVRFIGYYKDNENKQDSGFVTFEYVHQPDGSHNF